MALDVFNFGITTYQYHGQEFLISNNFFQQKKKEKNLITFHVSKLIYARISNNYSKVKDENEYMQEVTTSSFHHHHHVTG